MLDPQLIPTPLTTAEEMRPPIIVEPRGEKHRLTSIVVKFAHWLFDIFWMWVRGRWTSRANALRTRAMLEDLGFLWIKFGQLLSLRTDFFSAEFCSELGQLQYSAHGFPPATARKTIEDELGRPVEEIFADYEEMPFAAASIAQVHRAKLRSNGVEVVIKVMRPGAERVFATDMRVIKRLVAVIQRLGLFSFMRWSEAVWELEQIMAEEVNYRFEVSNLRRMRAELRKHNVYVPKVFGIYCTSHVLVMEFIRGTLMSDYIEATVQNSDRVALWLSENNINPETVGRRLYMSFMRQLFEEDLFHGDLHPGNIILLRDSRFALIDLGTAGSVENELLRKYIFITKAIGNLELQKAADLVLSLCPEFPPVDLVEVREEMVRSLRAWAIRTPVKELSYYEKSLTYAIIDLVRIMAERRIAITWGFMKIDRTWATMDASMNYLMPKVNYPLLIRTYFEARAGRQLERTFRLETLFTSVLDIRDLLSEYSLFIDPQIRRASRVFASSGSRLSAGIGVLFEILSTAAVLGGVYLVGAFLHQYYGFLIGPQYRIPQLYLNKVPRMTPELWIPLIIMDIYLYFKFRKLRRLMTQKGIPLEEGSNSP